MKNLWPLPRHKINFMDYEPTNQNQPVESSGSIWKWIVIIAILIAAGLAWYFYFYQPASVPAPQPSAGESQPLGAISSGDTTADIANDLNQPPDDSAATQEMDSFNQDIQNF